MLFHWVPSYQAHTATNAGGSNVQMGIDPEDGEMMIIEMNPRVSRSSALASKATGFPIAKIAAKLAVGLTLDQIPNDITLKTPASFEPSIDYIVTKVEHNATIGHFFHDMTAIMVAMMIITVVTSTSQCLC